MKEADLRDLACPGPVIELKKLLQEGHREILLLVADELSRSNVTRFASSFGAGVVSEEAAGGGFAVTVTSDESVAEKARGSDPEAFCEVPEETGSGSGPLVVQVTSSTMGRGDDDLGALLLRSFVNTLGQLDRKPDTMLFYNSGVHLCCEGSNLLEALGALADAGVEILACGTCLNYFEKSDRLRVGRVTDMLEIATRLTAAGRIVRP